MVAECKEKQLPKIQIEEKHDRLAGTEPAAGTTEPAFQWSKLYQLIKPQLHYILAAVAVR